MKHQNKLKEKLLVNQKNKKDVKQINLNTP